MYVFKIIGTSTFEYKYPVQIPLSMFFTLLNTSGLKDEIIVLSEGKIVERGNHTDLVEKNGVYKTLINLQNIQ